MRRVREATTVATLCWVLDDDRALLIEKKRGVGAGLYNAPGGKVEDDETPRECARRETREEVGVTPFGMEKVGTLDFTFGDDPFMFVYVFRADDYEGSPRETAEARPAWFDTDSLPYEEMWEDDRYWVPHLLAGETFHGDAVFDADGDELREWSLETDVTF